MAGRLDAGSHLHVITPGDHFSPSTGSAIPTVVHGLAAATPAGLPRPRVVVAAGTYPDRYGSADVVEFQQSSRRVTDRYVDAVAARLGLPRVGARREVAPVLADQDRWPPSAVLAHNLPQLIGLVDVARHAAVLYAHNELFRTYSPREAGRTLDAAGAIVCVSEFLAARIADRLPPSLHDRVAVVRNGVDVEAFRPDPARVPGSSIHVVYVGRMVRDKGPDLLVDALVRLARADVRATVVGTVGFAPDAPPSEFERVLRRTAAPLGDAVTWLPFQTRSEVARLLCSADVVVVPSRWPEPFALAALEGMASGAAAIAARIGGIPEAVGEAGVLVPPDDAAAIAEAIEAFAEDRTLLARAQAASRAHAVAHDWSLARRTLDGHLERLGLTHPVPSDRS